MQAVEDLIPSSCTIDYASVSIDISIQSGKIEVVDIEELYINHVKTTLT